MSTRKKKKKQQNRQNLCHSPPHEELKNTVPLTLVFSCNKSFCKRNTSRFKSSVWLPCFLLIINSRMTSVKRFKDIERSKKCTTKKRSELFELFNHSQHPAQFCMRKKRRRLPLTFNFNTRKSFKRSWYWASPCRKVDC